MLEWQTLLLPGIRNITVNETRTLYFNFAVILRMERKSFSSKYNKDER